MPPSWRLTVLQLVVRDSNRGSPVGLEDLRRAHTLVRCVFLQLREPLLPERPAIIFRSRRQERGPGVGGLAEGRPVVDRGGVVDIDTILLTIFATIA